MSVLYWSQLFLQLCHSHCHISRALRVDRWLRDAHHSPHDAALRLPETEIDRSPLGRAASVQRRLWLLHVVRIQPRRVLRGRGLCEHGGRQQQVGKVENRFKITMSIFHLSMLNVDSYICLQPTAEGPNNYLNCFSSCCSSGHLVNLLLGCTSGLNLATDLRPVLALFSHRAYCLVWKCKVGGAKHWSSVK